MQIERVLIANDPSTDGWNETLFSTARGIAAPADATVYVLNLFTEEEYDEMQTEMGGGSGFGTLGPDEFAGRVTGIQTESERFEERGVDYEIRGVRGGEPAEQIRQRIEELDVDLVLVSGEQRSPTGKALFGDLAQEILLQAPVPVVYVRQDLDDDS